MVFVRLGRWTCSLGAWIAAAAFALILGGCWSKDPAFLIPPKNSAYEQYVFAYQERAKMYIVPPKQKPAMRERIIKCYEEVLTRFPKDTEVTPLAYLDLGDLFATEQDFGNAFKYFEKAQKNYATNDKVQAYSRMRRGELYEIKKEKVKARDLYKECYELYRDHPDKAVKEISDRAYKLFNKVM